MTDSAGSADVVNVDAQVMPAAEKPVSEGRTVPGVARLRRRR